MEGEEGKGSIERRSEETESEKFSGRRQGKFW